MTYLFYISSFTAKPFFEGEKKKKEERKKYQSIAAKNGNSDWLLLAWSFFLKEHKSNQNTGEGGVLAY